MCLLSAAIGDLSGHLRLDATAQAVPCAGAARLGAAGLVVPTQLRYVDPKLERGRPAKCARFASDRFAPVEGTLLALRHRPMQCDLSDQLARARDARDGRAVVARADAVESSSATLRPLSAGSLPSVRPRTVQRRY